MKTLIKTLLEQILLEAKLDPQGWDLRRALLAIKADKGGFNIEKTSPKLRESIAAAKKLLRSFIFLRQNLDKISENDVRELTKSLTECSEKFEKCVQKIKNVK